MMNKNKLLFRRERDPKARNRAVAALLAVILAASASIFPLSAQSSDTVHKVSVPAINESTDARVDHPLAISNISGTAAEAQPNIIPPVAPRATDMVTAQRSLSPFASMGTSRVYYPYPWGAMAVTLYLDGKRVLPGAVADIGGIVYVPVQRYAELFGSFKTTYEEATERVTISGKNLYITVQVGDPYITVNDRIFYTGSKVLSLGGWIFVPINAMSKAMGATVYVKKGYYETYVASGDPTAIKWASEYYNSTDLYWLSRIISAEAKGEPLAGQIAVGNVVLNRKRSTSFPNTVKDVIFDKKYGVQFSPVSNGTIYQTPVSSATVAAKACLEGYSLSTRVLYFFNPSLTSATWIASTRPYIMTIGNHKFYG